jgi:hypothetical protein
MHVFSIAVVALSFLSALHAVGARVAEQDDWKGFYFTLNSLGGGCLGPTNGSVSEGTSIILNKCSPDDDTIQWKFDRGYRLRNKANDTMCVQAGGTNGLAQDGTKIRLYPCSKSDLQKFELAEFLENYLYGPIKAASAPNLCMVRHGSTADIGVDPIILKECNSLDEERAEGWVAD